MKIDITGKTVYIAGKITGDPGYFEKFANAAERIRAAGGIPLSPGILPPVGFSYGAYIRISAAMLDECEIACFLPDWKDSNGARGEFRRAQAKGKTIIQLEDLKTGSTGR